MKNNVKVNVGDPGYAVYVRAAVVVTWKDASGNVLGTAPAAGTDYTIEFGENWTHIGGFYYYNTAIDEGQTSVLIKTCFCSPIVDPPAGYGLNVEIIAQTIQTVGQTDGTDPVDAVKDAWGVAASQFITPTS